VNEIQEALSSDSLMVQYHAMGLLYHIRRRDRLAVSKMVTKQIRSSLRSPHGYCLLVRIACKILEDEERGGSSLLYDFLETCLRHKSEVGVVMEGGRVLHGCGRGGCSSVNMLVGVVKGVVFAAVDGGI
jgi:coatomer protein complex subunit gamma